MLTNYIYNRLINLYKYSDEENEYLKNTNEKFIINESQKLIGIQVQTEVETLARFIAFSNKKKHSLVGINFIKPHYSLFDIFFLPILLIKLIEQFFLRRKLHGFHEKLNLENFISTPGFFNLLKFIPKSIILFFRINNKNDVLLIKHDDILIGDLIYDTYLRFFKKPTLNIRDFNLIFLIARTYAEINYLETLSKKINVYLTGYTSYTNSGLPARIFVKNGVEVITFIKFINGKKLSIKDFSQAKKYWEFKSDFSSLEDKERKIGLGLDLLENRLNGINDLNYMRVNTYSNNIISGIKKHEGILFLHDFTDSNHIYRHAVFPDFYEWAVFTFNLIAEHNLNIGIKPHPNQNSSSRKIVKKLKAKFNYLNWLDEEISNSQLLNSGIKFGISVYGTVLTELAFQNIIPICCGDNPTINYDFTFNANTKEEYEDFIINHNKLIFRNNRLDEIGEFVFMNHIN
jgi:hypothetical protein